MYIYRERLVKSNKNNSITSDYAILHKLTVLSLSLEQANE